ncbi:MAG: peptidase M3, partial [Muribaculaceae bacterium]|nr:peptidase M3 [Muribaculaceae bacterium]
MIQNFKTVISAALLAAASFTMQAENPLFEPFTGTEHGTAPFSQFNDTLWEPAIDRGIERARQEIDAITRQRSRPTFENTIVALERSGEDLNRVLNVFFPLLSAESSDEMMDIASRVSEKLSDYSTAITLNEALWQRVEQVYDMRQQLDLSPEEQMLLQTTYDSFALAGARLKGEDREKFRNLSAELSSLTTDFGQNVLREMRQYEIWLGADDLSGLPQTSVNAAAEAANAKGRPGEYLFTLDQPVYVPFLKYSDRADLREKMWRLYNGRNTKGEFSNIDNIKRISEIRMEIARLLGKDTYAGHKLQRTMAGSPEKVYDLLDRLRDAYRPALNAEMAELTDFASRLEGHPVTINPWDYSYYSNKLKAEKYSFDDEALRPYFELGNVVKGVFGLATRLYGLQFTENPAV